MTRLYGTSEWQEDLKNILGRAVSSLDQHVVFLFNDSEVNCIYLFYLQPTTEINKNFNNYIKLLKIRIMESNE